MKNDKKETISFGCLFFCHAFGRSYRWQVLQMQSEYARKYFSLKFSVYKFCEKFRKKDKIIAFSVATFRESVIILTRYRT